MIVKKLFVLLLVATTSIAVPSHRLRTRIHGGKYADRGQFPYFVSFRLNDPFDGAIHQCGGAIISEKFVLLAGHCTDTYRPATNYVVATRTHSRTDGELYQVKAFHRHENFVGSTLSHDIALVELAEPIQFSDDVQPIALDPNYINADIHGIVPGLGETDDYYTDLKYIHLTTITDEACRERYANKRVALHEPQTLCAFEDPHAGTRTGDSGGPFVANNHLIGIVSWGYKPCVGYPDVFTRISEFYEWIQTTMNSVN